MFIVFSHAILLESSLSITTPSFVDIMVFNLLINIYKVSIDFIINNLRFLLHG